MNLKGLYNAKSYTFIAEQPMQIILNIYHGVWGKPSSSYTNKTLFGKGLSVYTGMNARKKIKSSFCKKCTKQTDSKYGHL